MSSADIPQLNCPKCGGPLQRGGDLAGQCFVCLLESGLEEEEMPTAANPEPFGHYQVVTSTDGTPLELGRGAMGVTYKAFDLDLQYAVTLKVISEKYLGDESMRLRFLREARAAASLRHPNVASVFHLGKSGENYFYAMEFVEGETLESLIKRLGRIEVKLALEIMTQVATGLQRQMQTNAAGEFEFIALENGPYTLAVTKPGFKLELSRHAR